MATMASVPRSALRLKIFVVAATVVAALLIKVGVPVLPVAAGLVLAGVATWRGWLKV